MTTQTQVCRYRLIPDAMASQQRQLTSIFLPFGMFLLAAVLFFAFRRGKLLELPVLLLAVGFVGFIVLMAYRLKAQITTMWQTYELQIGPDYLCRRQGGLPPLTIRFSEVSKVVHIPGRQLRVFSRGGTVINIPEQIENFSEIQGRLSSFTSL